MQVSTISADIKTAVIASAAIAHSVVSVASAGLQCTDQQSLKVEMDVMPKKHTKIVTLSEYTTKTYREIACIVGVSHQTVSRVLRLKKDTGSISPKRKGNCSRKRKTTSRDDVTLLRESRKYPRKTSDALNMDLKSKGITISSSTVRRRLLEAGRRARRPIKKQLLTKVMKEKRYK